MPIQERWFSNGGVRLHCLEVAYATDTAKVPLLIVPGVFGTAEDYIDEMTALAPRRCLAVSLRGRGRSDAPRRGYALEDHASDIAAAVAQSGAERLVLMGYAMGAAYMLAYATAESTHIAGLIIGEYPARYRRLSRQWVERALESMGERARPDVADALQQESSDVSLWERLDSMKGPVMVLRGAGSNSMVTAEVAARYRRYLPNAEIVTLDGNGHDLWRPDFSSYIRAISSFLSSIDAAVQST